MGGRVRPHALFRGDAPAQSDPPPSLPGWPPATVVDLRSVSEYVGPHPLTEFGATIHRVPLSKKLNVLDFDADDILKHGGLAGLYEYTIDGAEQAIVEAVDVVAKSEHPVLVHCTLGKDRTGIVVATILGAIGVSVAGIIADYVETGPNVHRILARLAALDSPAAVRIQELAGTYPEALEASAEAIEAVLRLHAEAGGADRWLLAHGMTTDSLAQLRARLLTSSNGEENP